MQAEFNLAHSIKRLLTRERCEQLDLDGYLVLDEQPLPTAAAKELLCDVKRCFHDVDGGAVPNQVEFLTADGPVKLTKPNIYECDLHNAAIRRQLPHFDALFQGQLGELVEVLRDRVSCCEDLQCCDTADLAARAVTVKLQMNVGGAFPWHYDNPGKPNKRRLTMAVYLTEDSSPEMGGELQLMPFLGPRITVPPRFCTVVLFRSDRTLHRVLPIAGHLRKTRYCFTIWFDGALTNSDDDLLLKVQHLEEAAIPLLRRSAVQRTLSRAVYESEYEASLVDCFGADSTAFKISLREHRAHLQQLLKHDKLRAFLEVLREYREDLRAE
ncbi:2OG-Fe(II) oxygenase superfamily [Novymonas esmeraldas]|uniref:2OG-Fe(II) oxygenase superfamily n=1 Tax=Novymonas esmeraldas TaxID=1808958 RepID=A0AAW0EXE7_9TRYP